MAMFMCADTHTKLVKENVAQIIKRHEAYNQKSAIQPILYSNYFNFWVLKKCTGKMATLN